MNPLKLIGREKALFTNDLDSKNKFLSAEVKCSRFLVLGGAGTIGQAVTKEIFQRNPKKLHVVDISENNLVELVRDLRSSYGYIDGDFKTYAIDIASVEYDAFIKHDGKYDYVLNLSALKHVRSEQDPFTLMRMIDVNIINTVKTINQSIENGVKKYFCVSTDKAANPVNMMGASKRIMELFLERQRTAIDISTARFANVAFSDGSLLHGFNQRFQKKQPIVAPNDIKRYFITPTESGQLCLLSCIFGENGDIFFPKLSKNFDLLSFSEIAINYLNDLGYQAELCESEQQARELALSIIKNDQWPCFFSESDTTGEKSIEEFYTKHETLDMSEFDDIGIIKPSQSIKTSELDDFIKRIDDLKNNKSWNKKDILDLFISLVPEFLHDEKNRYLGDKM